jgi:hypothetical protein
MIGYGYFIETIIFNFLGSYDYNHLGAFVSNAFCLPVIATFNMNWIWIVLFSGFFTGIEFLFLELHIYSHNWWRLEYTGLGIAVYFAVGNFFYKRILHPTSGFKHNLILYFISGSISASMHVLPIIFSQIEFTSLDGLKIKKRTPLL